MLRYLVLFTFYLVPMILSAQKGFDDYFTTGVFRFDYLLSGKNNYARVTPLQQKLEPVWGGVQKLQVDGNVLGNYRFTVKDLASQTPVFQQGFSPLFQEWQTTAEARAIERAFYQVIRFPFPKNKVLLEIDFRNRDGIFENIYTVILDPVNYFITKELPNFSDCVMVQQTGDPSEKVDVVLLAEGYRKEEMGKFVKDAERLTKALFSVEPFAANKSKFNIYAVQTPSVESGTDIPGRNIYANTLYNSTFYTFDIARYLTTTDLKSVYDHAAALPYDYLIVLVNSPEYGGGGFCNYLSVCTSDHALAEKVFIHEFGHEFAGLGDEYYTSEVAYENYYNLSIEPWEPNLTTLVDFKTKWGALMDPSTPVPTPRTPEFANKTGVFEGGGYVARGVFSPMDDCRMKSNKPDSFCPVCQQAISKAIQRCTE